MWPGLSLMHTAYGAHTAHPNDVEVELVQVQTNKKNTAEARQLYPIVDVIPTV